MTYEEQCKSLGIERPASLTRGFAPDMPSLTTHKEPGYRKEIGPRVEGEVEDLTHLNPARGAKCQEQVKAWWDKLTPKQRASLNQGRFPRTREKQNWWARPPK